MFKYLGSFVTYTSEVETGIKARIYADNKCYHALGIYERKDKITHSLRVDLCKIIRPFMACGAQSWTLTNKIEGTYKEILEKKIYRLAYEHRYWRIKIKKFIINFNIQIS
jgi:hypothetical protein